METPQSTESVRAIHSVSQLCARTRDVLEQNLGTLWVGGEVASFSAPASGHWYLTLKDDSAQLRCVMFRTANSKCSKPQVGDEVLVCGRFSLYEARGEIQIVLSHLEARGSGQLFAQFEALKEKLKAEGLFDNEFKKPIPALPRCIALITSPTGAAIEDIKRVFQRHRFSGVLRVYPAQVQGDSAPSQLIAALQQVEREGLCDLALITRGGGSYEDLFCFNDEKLARTIFAMSTPVISAVGHDTDSTLSDFAADTYSATPTAAAELILAPWAKLAGRVSEQAQHLQAYMGNLLTEYRHRLRFARGGIENPVRRIQSASQQLDALQMRQFSALEKRLSLRERSLERAGHRLDRLSPERRLLAAQDRLTNVGSRVLENGRQISIRSNQKLRETAALLNAVSPIATLARGYSVLFDSQQRVISNAEEVRVGQVLSARLHRGTLDLEIIQQGKTRRDDST